MARIRRRSRTTWTFTLVNVAFVVAAAAIAVWTLYPVFESARFLWVTGAAVATGVLITVLCDRLGLKSGAATLMALGAYVVLSMTLAIPGATSGVSNARDALVETVRGPVFGWMDIVTLPLPLGEYRGTLVPVLALFLAASLLASWAAVRAERFWALSAVTMVALEVVCIVIGPAIRSEAYTWVPYGEYISREFLEGLALFLVLLSWLGWRAAYARRRALAYAHGAGSARLAKTPHVHVAGGIVAVVVIVAVAVSAGVLVAGPIAAQTPREVARAAIDPQVTIDESVSPTAVFRGFYENEAYDAVLFTVDTREGTAERVRVAALPYYDGESFTATAPPSVPPAAFLRVPSAAAASHATQPVKATITVGAHSGIWVPIVGELGSVTFEGSRRAVLVDGFYYLPDADVGIVATEGGLVTGDSYTVDGFTPGSARTLADSEGPGGPVVIDRAEVPESLREWVERQELGSGAGALEELVRRLRARGYLSHSLSTPDETPQWQTDLGQYAFEPAAAGQSYDRIDRLFTSLLERQDEVGDTDDDSLLVAAAGDEEQFAAAAALVATHLGYPARVVLGARVSGEDPYGWAPAACDSGACRGKNMTIWTEVQDDTGAWIALDTTPQHDNLIAPTINQERDPEFATALDPAQSEAIVPPSSQRGASSDEEVTTTTDEETVTGLSATWVIAGLSLLGLLILVGPFLLIIVWKVLRRRYRRRGAPGDVVHHGWDEYLDIAVDSGLEPMPLATRVETATAYGSPNGVAIAQMTDRVSFSGTPTSDDQAQAFWELVAADRAYWLGNRGWFKRLRMRVTLRSLWSGSSERKPESAGDRSRQRQQWRTDRTGATRTGTGVTRGRRKKRRGA